MNPETRLPWPSIDELSSKLALPSDVELRLLRNEDLRDLPAQLVAWYPSIRVGSESIFLEQDFLERNLVRENNFSGDVYAAFIVQRGMRVGFMSFERQPANGTLHARLGALAPEARTGLLGMLGFVAFEHLGTLCAAELLLAWVTLAGKHQQLFAERRGFQLVGLVPGFDRDQITEARSLRVTEALYAKTLVPDEELLAPSPDKLTPKTLRFMEAMREINSSAVNRK